MLKAEAISKSYGERIILHDIDLDAPDGSIFGLLGPNGAGKTTLIRILTRITAPDSGKISFRGAPLDSVDISSFGYLPEERGLYRKMRVWEQAVYLVRLKGLSKEAATQNLRHWFSKMSMDSWWNKPVESLSKGMQQRLQFVIAVAHDPSMIILDEPFSGFDPIHADEIKEQIRQLRMNGKTIILSTHNMGSVEELCDYAMFLNSGSCVLSGSIPEIKKQFSKNLFHLRFEGSRVAFANALSYQFEIVSLIEREQVIEATVKSHQSDTSLNQLVRQLMDEVRIISFTEMQPTMHDIFIDVISRENTKGDE